MKLSVDPIGLTLACLLSLPASGQVSGKIFHLKQPWQKTEIDFGAMPPAFEKGWNMAVDGTRPDMDEGLNELLEPIENALSQPFKKH